MCVALTMAALLLMISALSTKPNVAGGTSGFIGGCVTPYTTCKAVMAA